MKNVLKSQFIVFTLIFLFPAFADAAINQQSNPNQDSTLVMNYTGSSEKKKDYVFHKGDKVIYKNAKGKHKVEIIGFAGKDIIIKDIKTKKIESLNLEKVYSFKEYSESEEGNLILLKAISGISLAAIIGISFSERDTPYLGGLGVFIIFMVFFIPALLVVFVLNRLISISKRPIYNIRRGYRFVVKG